MKNEFKELSKNMLKEIIENEIADGFMRFMIDEIKAQKQKGMIWGAVFATVFWLAVFLVATVI